MKFILLEMCVFLKSIINSQLNSLLLMNIGVEG